MLKRMWNSAVAFDQRVDGAADVRSQDQRQCCRWRDKMRICQRHNEEHAGDTRMHGPSDDCRKDDAKHGIAGHRAHQHANAWRILRRRKRIEQDMERQQHQAQADRDAPEILEAGARPAAEGNQTQNKKDRRNGCYIEREHLNNQRGADIGAQHDRKRRHRTDETVGSEGTRHKGSRSAALEQRCQSDSGGKGAQAVVEGFSEPQPEVRAESAQNPAVDHMQAPQQQCHAAHQIEKNHASHRSTLGLCQRFKLTPIDSGSMFLLLEVSCRTETRRRQLGSK